MPSLSPRPLTVTMPVSSHDAGSAANLRPSNMKRHSSQSSQTSKLASPGSAEHYQPLRHTVKRPGKLVLSRNTNSGRNLTKLGRAPPANVTTEGSRKHSKQKNNNDFRLPGSLGDEKDGVESRPGMRRNYTAYQLPRNSSHSKLKKNLSHGQLTRLGSGRNLHALHPATAKGPPSPGLKNRSKRTRSAEVVETEKDLHEQEVEIAQQQQHQHDAHSPHKKVGFAVGSSGDGSDDEDIPQMEGSGLQEDEWTEESASASPYSTRQNTANNSRRTSISVDKSERRAVADAANAAEARKMSQPSKLEPKAEDEVENTDEADGTPVQSYEAEDDTAQTREPVPVAKVKAPNELRWSDGGTLAGRHKASQRSTTDPTKDAPNPAARHVMGQGDKLPAPALLSNVSAEQTATSKGSSPAPSLRTLSSNVGDSTTENNDDELVSRFIPSTSHPSSGSVGNTTVNTPKTGSYQTPENEKLLTSQQRNKPGSSNGVQHGPTSPVSARSASSGFATPAMGRSRVELRMLNEKAMAEIEDAARNRPNFPPNQFDRRNESLKSWLNLVNMGVDGRSGLAGRPGSAAFNLGPEIFQGRFKAVNTELKVVQKFRDPIAESVARLQACKGTVLANKKAAAAAASGKGGAAAHKSSGSLSGSSSHRVNVSNGSIKSNPPANLPKHLSKLSTSSSPPHAPSAKSATYSTKSPTQSRRSGGGGGGGRVKFSVTPPDAYEAGRREVEMEADAIARKMWEAVGTGSRVSVGT